MSKSWARLPKERWPKGWHGKYKDPVVKSVLTLYGHRIAEASGGNIAKRCWKMLGFTSSSLQRVAIYVDDCKMAGPKQNMAKGWELIASKIDMDTFPG